MWAGSGIGGDMVPAELVSTLTSVTVSKCSLTYVIVRNPSRSVIRVAALGLGETTLAQYSKSGVTVAHEWQNPRIGLEADMFTKL